MPVKLETAQVPVILTGKEWAALCVRFVLNESLSGASVQFSPPGPPHR